MDDDNLMTVSIIMNDGGLELRYEEVKDFAVKSLEQCIIDGMEVSEEDMQTFGAKDLFFVFHSNGYVGLYPLCLCSAMVG